MLTFAEARRVVLERVRQATRRPETERVALREAAGRVLAEAAHADRDYPPFDRATRDGFAVRAADLVSIPCELMVVGEVRAGTAFEHRVGPGQCVSIMTGAPVPAGCDAVVMIEYTEDVPKRASDTRVRIDRAVAPGENVVPRGSESQAGSQVLPAGRRIGYAEAAVLASIGRDPVAVRRRPRVAILPTGDEVVEAGRNPLPWQIRNSNSHSLCVQVEEAGGIACPLGIAPDEPAVLGRMIDEGLTHDLLLLSGGVSMGKYDLVEQVLRERAAEFFFDAVAIQPGRPLVFGRVGRTFFFGLPGNPLSTMVTFELFARPAVELLAGSEPNPLLFLRARLAAPVRHKPGLTRFLPALLAPSEPRPSEAPWSAGVPPALGPRASSPAPSEAPWSAGVPPALGPRASSPAPSEARPLPDGYPSGWSASPGGVRPGEALPDGRASDGLEASDGFEPEVRLVEWHGSGDLAALARANCYLVVPDDREELPAGEMVGVLLRRF